MSTKRMSVATFVAVAAAALGASVAYAVSARHRDEPKPTPPNAVVLAPGEPPCEVHFGWIRKRTADGVMHLTLALTAVPADKDHPLDGQPWPVSWGGRPVVGARIRFHLSCGPEEELPRVGSFPIAPWFRPLPGCSFEDPEVGSPELPADAYLTTDARGLASVEFTEGACVVAAQAEFHAAAGGTLMRRASATFDGRGGR